MTSTGKSRWAENADENAEAIAQRKKEKEDKKRAKEEKLRKAEAQQADGQRPIPQADVNGDLERSSKRLKTADDAEQSAGDATGESELLTFPVQRFGPCRSVEEYDRLNDIEEGSYGLVSRARQKATGTIVALKKLKMDYANDGFPVTGLREIQTLMASRHPHIVHLREVVMGSTLKE
jgi:cell division cycle 2-like